MQLTRDFDGENVNVCNAHPQNLRALTLALHCASHLNLDALGGLSHLHTLSLTSTRFALPMDLPSGSFPVLKNLRINLPLRWGVADVATAPVTELLANLLPICGLRTLVGVVWFDKRVWFVRQVYWIRRRFETCGI